MSSLFSAAFMVHVYVHISVGQSSPLTSWLMVNSLAVHISSGVASLSV